MRRKKKRLIILSILFILLIVIVIIIIHNNKKNSFLVGEWVTPGGTIYIFNKNYKGLMKVPSKEYEFVYKIKNNQIEIDYEDESAFDPTYDYKIENDKLVLSGVNGTFTFSKN